MIIKEGTTLCEALYMLANRAVELQDHIPVETESETEIGNRDEYVAKLKYICALMDEAVDRMENLISELPD